MNRRDQVRELMQQYRLSRKLYLEQLEKTNKLERDIAKAVEGLKPDPECSHAVSGCYDHIKICEGCFYAKRS